MEPAASLPHSQVPTTCPYHSDTNITKISYLQMLYKYQKPKCLYSKINANNWLKCHITLKSCTKAVYIVPIIEVYSWPEHMHILRITDDYNIKYKNACVYYTLDNDL